MKRSISNIIRSMFLVLALAFLIPFANVNAMTSSSGNGTETNPHILTIGYCENDAFAYNVNGGFCYLKVTFTESAEVSLSFAQTGPWFMVKRAGTTYMSLAEGDTFYAKKGETVDILIRSGASSLPIRFTSRKLSDLSLYCPKRGNGKHTFTASYGAKCANSCGYTCTHPKASREYYNDYKWLSNRQHAQYFTCNICECKDYDASEAKACTLGSWIADNNHSYHCAECTICGNSYQENCSFTKKTYKHYAWDTHFEYATCSKCGKTGNGIAKKHTFKSNKCTKCGFKRIVPGASKITYIKQTGGLKIKTYRRNGYFDKFLEWHPARTTRTYNYKIKIKFKKAKNAVRYVISTSKSINSPAVYTMGKSKTSATFTYSASSKKKQVTLYLIPISKTGTPGPAVKKVVKLSN